MKRKTKALIVGLVVLSISFALLGIQELKPMYDSEAKKNALKEIAVIETEDPMNRDIDFEALKKINEDVIGWVYIPKTSIDYPILKGDSDETYLDKDIEKKYARLGSITTYANTDESFNMAQTFLFGHNGIHRAMFGGLIDYTDERYRKEHSTIYVYSPHKTIKYHVFSIFIAKDTEDIYNTTIEVATKQHLDRINLLIQRNQYQDLQLESLDSLYQKEIVSLVTCYGGAGTPDRLLVNAYATDMIYKLD